MSARADIVLFADIRFPSPRANGIQVVKTAQALAARGRQVRLVVRHSDPRPTEDILADFGVTSAPQSGCAPRTGNLTNDKISQIVLDVLKELERRGVS